MRTLHVAALPFPSQQGTQALLHEMLVCLADAGHDTHLLCYAHGAFQRQTPYRVHRVRRLPLAHSLRSGPSCEKLVLDGLLVAALRRQVLALRPALIVAHHVEAALAAVLVGAGPLLFVAHTSMSAELPSYFPSALGGLLAAIGVGLDRFLSRTVDSVLAVSPLLAARLQEETDVPVLPLQLPWTVPRPIHGEERRRARGALGLEELDEVVLYAGNLDAYQGLGPLVEGLSLVGRPRLRWLIATASEPDQLMPRLSALGLTSRVHFSRLAGEADRQRAYAAADAVVVPRQCPGGVPIKLLDALARGVPVLAVQRALAGLSLSSLCTVIADDDARAWQEAVTAFFEGGRQDRAAAARSHMQLAHSPAQFVADFMRHAESCRAAAVRQRAGFFRSARGE